MMRLNKISFCWLILSLSFLAQARLVQVKAEVQVMGSNVTIQDLLVDSSVMSQDERKLVVLTVPKNGQAQYTLVNIAYAMQRFSSLNDLRLSGARQVQIKRLVNPAFLELAQLKIRTYMLEKMAYKESEFETQLSNQSLQKLQQKSDCHSLLVKSIRETSDPFKLELKVDCMNEADEKESLSLEMYLRRSVEILSFKSSLKKGHILSASDLEKKLIWIDKPVKNYLHKKEDALGYELLQAVQKDLRVSANHLAEPICAKRGDIIEALVRAGSIELSATVKAEQTGRRGDIIRVKNVKSGKSFEAKLISLRKAQIL